MAIQVKYIPALLSQRYEKMVELRKAEDLQITLRESNIISAEEKAFVDARIQELNAYLQETLPAAEKIIDGIGFNIQAWNFARLHFLKGYSWPEIQTSLKLSQDMIRSTVIRAFIKANQAAGKGIKGVNDE